MSGTTLAGFARRVPWGFVGMVALVAIVEGAIHARSMALYDTDEMGLSLGRPGGVERFEGGQDPLLRR